MNYKIFIILIFLIFSGCKLETVNNKVNYDNNIKKIKIIKIL